MSYAFCEPPATKVLILQDPRDRDYHVFMFHPGQETEVLRAISDKIAVGGLFAFPPELIFRTVYGVYDD